MSINPIRPKVHMATSAPTKAKGSSRSAATAAKVNDVAQFPKVKQTGWRGREVTVLREAQDLAKSIRQNWDFLEPEVLAERIIDLEGRVAQLKGDSPAVAKIVKEARALHFRFVFPVALELEMSGKQMPPSFARTIHTLAKRIIDSNSVAPFNDLSSVQKAEILRGRGG